MDLFYHHRIQSGLTSLFMFAAAQAAWAAAAAAAWAAPHLLHLLR
jgi:hypothetical protein